MFTVLLSIYKKESPNYLKSCLDSLLNQTLPPDEIILVKDGPLTLNIDKIITEYQSICPTLRLFLYPKIRVSGKH